jgi:hypothetical protein
MLERIQPFQALIACGITFLGVVCTLLWNDYLARQARRETHRQETTSIRRALIEDLKYYHDDFVKLRDSAENPPENESIMRRMRVREAELYQVLMGRVGVLNAPETTMTIRAYGQVATVMTYLAEKSRTKDGGYYEFERIMLGDLYALANFACLQILETVRVLGEREKPEAAYNGGLALFENVTKRQLKA